MIRGVIGKVMKPLSTVDVLLALTMSEKQTLKEIDHTPPAGESVSNVWERGTEQAD